MLKFVRQLKSHYLQLIQESPNDSKHLGELKDSLSTLRLAEASLLKVDLNQKDPEHPLQIAILGPTQAGKSTLLNLITESRSAGVSALAGYTVHAHGYTFAVSENNHAWLDELFDGFDVGTSNQLDPDNYQQVGILSSPDTTLDSLPPCVIWDTPDFDSVEAFGYNTAVLRTLALADIVVLISSREKYADKSVWDLIELIEPLNKPMLVCINKLDDKNKSTIVNSFNERFHQVLPKSKAPTVLSIPFVKHLDDSASGLPSSIRNELIHNFQRLAKNIDREQDQLASYRFIESHWQPWIGPITSEHQANKLWNEIINSTLDGAESQYKRDYLNNPDSYDAFNRTLVQLLVLLEIPGVAETFSKARKLITWPIRKLIQIGKDKTGNAEPKEGMERIVLNNICNNSLTSLIASCESQGEKDQSQALWWNKLTQELLENRQSLKDGFEDQVQSYQSGFEQNIEDAARQLYKNLEQKPATLNSLRAARVTADAAAVGLALKTGGIGVNDLLLAPAMLSVTSMLTESALGKYIDRVKAKLRVSQVQAIRKTLLDDYLKHSLLGLSSPTYNDKHISEDILLKAETQLRNSRAK